MLGIGRDYWCAGCFFISKPTSSQSIVSKLFVFNVITPSVINQVTNFIILYLNDLIFALAGGGPGGCTNLLMSIFLYHTASQTKLKLALMYY